MVTFTARQSFPSFSPTVMISTSISFVASILRSSSPFTTTHFVDEPIKRLNESMRRSSVLKYSMWSRSIFSKTDISGDSFKKVSTYSHDSQTSVSELPQMPFALMSGSFPPMIADGERFASCKICVIIEVTVVFPWVPQTPITLSNFRVIAPSKKDLSSVGIERRSASTSSGLSFIIAAE